MLFDIWIRVCDSMSSDDWTREQCACLATDCCVSEGVSAPIMHNSCRFILEKAPASKAGQNLGVRLTAGNPTATNRSASAVAQRSDPALPLLALTRVLQQRRPCPDALVQLSINCCNLSRPTAYIQQVSLDLNRALFLFSR